MSPAFQQGVADARSDIAEHGLMAVISDFAACTRAAPRSTLSAYSRGYADALNNAVMAALDSKRAGVSL